MKPEELIEQLDLPESFHEIEENDLAGEWQRQPQSFLQIMVKLAEANKDKATAKAGLEECYATLSNAIRANPEKFRIVKITEATVEEVVLMNPQYKDLQKKFIDSSYLVDLLEAASKTMEHKKKALENLVYLTGQGIHSAPKAKPGTDAARTLRDQEARKNVEKAQKFFGKKSKNNSD